MKGFDDVAVFWDYGMLSPEPAELHQLTYIRPENCPIPSDASGYSVVTKLCLLSRHFGSVKVFKAYLDIAELPASRSVSIRSELQSSGVSLVDCPHNGRKDVADKMILGQFKNSLFFLTRRLTSIS